MERIDLTNTFGAAAIGAMATLVLYGITVLQAYFYFLHYPKDSVAFKLLVAFLCSLDTLHIIFVCHCIYYYLVTNYANPSALAGGVWSLYASVAVNVVTTCVVQSFFTRRIHHLTGPRTKYWLPMIVAVFVILHFGFGIETVVKSVQQPSLTAVGSVGLGTVLPFGVFAVMSDILVAACLCLLLWNNRSEMKLTNLIINRLMIWAVNRCLLTAAVAIVEMVVFSISTSNLWFLAIDFVIGKLYCNSLLATLNSRESIRATGSDHVHGIDVDSKNVVQLSSFPPSTSTSESNGPSESTGDMHRLGESKVIAEIVPYLP